MSVLHLARFHSSIVAFLALISFAGCGNGKTLTCANAEGRRAIVSEVDRLLSYESCTEALALVEAFYPQVDCATDDIRLARASANACEANINFFDLITDLGSNNIVGSELWVTLTKLFPSSLTDQRVTAGQNALDSLFAIRVPGSLTPPQQIINSTTAHPGSLVAAHRTEDSNIYSMLVSMSLIGSLQNRYGAPKANWHKGQKMGQTAGNASGWENPAYVDVYACTYASSILTLFDSITQVSGIIGTSLGSSVGSTLATAATTYSTLLDAACSAGCTACGGGVTCSSCPTELRNRNACLGASTDKYSCAAAGIVQFMDTHLLGWQN